MNNHPAYRFDEIFDDANRFSRQHISAHGRELCEGFYRRGFEDAENWHRNFAKREAAKHFQDGNAQSDARSSMAK